MPSLVIDSSVVINWLIPQTYTPQALKLLKQYQLGEWEFLAVNHIYSEVGNGIWRLQRANIISAADAKTALETFLRQPFHLTSASELLMDAIRFLFNTIVLSMTPSILHSPNAKNAHSSQRMKSLSTQSVASCP